LKDVYTLLFIELDFTVIVLMLFSLFKDK